MSHKKVKSLCNSSVLSEISVLMFVDEELPHKYNSFGCVEIYSVTIHSFLIFRFIQELSQSKLQDSAMFSGWFDSNA